MNSLDYDIVRYLGATIIAGLPHPRSISRYRLIDKNPKLITFIHHEAPRSLCVEGIAAIVAVLTAITTLTAEYTADRLAIEGT